MGDMAENLKRLLRQHKLQELHKTKGAKFEAVLHEGGTDLRNLELNQQRRQTRNNLLQNRRHIEPNMSPVTPRPKSPHQAPVDKELPPKLSRLELFAQWKVNKEAKKEAAKKATKPIFKVCHINKDVGLPNWENVNKEIKGKKFAPDNHKFKPPANLKPVTVPPPPKTPLSRPVTRSMTTKTRNPTAEPAAADKRIKTPVKRKPADKASSGRQQAPAHSTKSVKNGTNSRTKQDKVDGVGRKQAAPSQTRALKPAPPKTPPSNLRNPNKTVPDEASMNHNATEVRSISKLSTKRTSAKVKTPEPSSVKTPVANVPETHNVLVPSLSATISPVTHNQADSSPIKTPARIIPNAETPTELYRTALENNKTPARTVPHLSGDDVPVYISPFVVVSRGKNSARKEYEHRQSRGGTLPDDLSQHSSPTAGAKYFTVKLDNEIVRLEELCDQWNKYKEDESPAEEAVEMINVAIGQCKLLITKKFQQFRGLITQCRDQTSDKPVTCTDLHGFWDMIFIQVVNLDERFANLDRLRATNWEIILPEKKKSEPKRRGKPKKKAAASSALREAIQAARRKNVAPAAEATESAPVISTPASKRRSSVQSIVRNETGPRISSPGLTMMKVSQFGKTYTNDTPAKSILKNVSSKSSTARKSKAVLFIQDVDDVENDLNQLNASFTSTTTMEKERTTRRSTRLSRAKLF